MSAKRPLKCRINPNTGCWEVISHSLIHGYCYIRRNKKHISAHRLVWEQANGPIPTGMCVCHKCDNPRCINVAHLFLGTQAENLSDMVRKSRAKTPWGGLGERNANARLTEEQALAIRHQCSIDGSVQAEIAREYGVSTGTVWSIVHRRRWGHI